jgi:predicted transcriptional regulator of viral defense system
MPSKSASLPSSLNNLSRFSFAQARAAGLSQAQVARLESGAVIRKIARGIYEVVGRESDPATQDFAIACISLGKQAVIGGLTALFYYGLAEEVPAQLWVLVPPNIYRMRTDYRLIRTKLDLTIGVERHPDFRITSLERTIVDAFIFSSKIGEKIAYRAALRAIRERRTNADKIFRLAKKLGQEEKLAVHAQAIFGGLEA